jgi:hypothetical protein
LMIRSITSKLRFAPLEGATRCGAKRIDDPRDHLQAALRSA